MPQCRLFSAILCVQHRLDLVLPLLVLGAAVLRADHLELVELALQLGLPLLIGVWKKIQNAVDL